MNDPEREDGDLSGLIASLAAAAAAALQRVSEAVPRSEQPEAHSPTGGDAVAAATGSGVTGSAAQGLEEARHIVDTLVALERKTKGNLTPGEEQLLRAALTDLRVAYVRAADLHRAARS